MRRLKNNNYNSWNISLGTFPIDGSIEEKIKFILQYALLAPSSHNTQPWIFSVIDSKINIRFNIERKLPISDPVEREMYISMGCCISNIYMALNAFEVPYKADFIINNNAEDFLCRIIIQKDFFHFDAAKKNIFLKSIQSRHSNRKFHDISNFHQRKLENILDEFSESELKDSSIDFSIISHENKNFKKIADLSVSSLKKAMSNKLFTKELSDWVKNNYTKSSVGMPGFLMNVPTPVSFFLPLLIKYFPSPQKNFEDEMKLFLEGTQSFLVVSGDDTKESWIKTGIEIQKFLIFLEKEGYSASFHTAIIEIDDFHDQLQKIMVSKKRPLCFLRIGKAKEIGKTAPRLSLNESLS